MQIGRTVYYDLATENVIQDTGERSGAVVETTKEQDFLTYSTLQGIDPASVGVLEFEYGYRSEEIHHRGSWKVVNGELIIYPHFTFTQNKSSIQADGVDTSTITVHTQGNENVLFIMDGVEYPRTPINGVCTFAIDSDLPGTIIMTITSEKYGQAVATIEVI